MHRLALFLWLCVTVVATQAAAVPAPDARAAKTWEAYVGAYAANGDFSGVVLVTRHGKRIFEKAAGFASVPFDQPNRIDTRFPVASVTKTFTAAGIALLQNDGKLKIEDGLDVYLPDFAPASKIKLWHLLAHESGLADPDYDAIAARSVSPDDLLAMIAGKPLLFEPGSGDRYSNAGYIVLARVIEKVGGEPFGDFVARRIFAPLGMTNTGTLESGEIVPMLADGYIPGVGTGVIRPQPIDPSSLYGSGPGPRPLARRDRQPRALRHHEATLPVRLGQAELVRQARAGPVRHHQRVLLDHSHRARRGPPHHRADERPVRLHR
jgi:CubicO group peptidase (beta-lactamase class C family)